MPHRPTWEAELNSALQGLHGPALTLLQLEQAIGDYVGNGAAAQPSLRHFRAYLRDAGRKPEERTGVGKRPAKSWSRRNDDVLKRFGEEEE